MRGCGAEGVISLLAPPVTGCRRRGMNQSCPAAGNDCWRSSVGLWLLSSSLAAVRPEALQEEHSRVPGVPWGCARVQQEGQSCHHAPKRQPCGDAGAAAAWEMGVSGRPCDAGVTGLLSIWQPLVLNERVSANTDPNCHSSSRASSACSPQAVRCSLANASISFPCLN